MSQDEIQMTEAKAQTEPKVRVQRGVKWLACLLYNASHKLSRKCYNCGSIIPNTGGHYGAFGVAWCYFPNECPTCKKTLNDDPSSPTAADSDRGRH